MSRTAFLASLEDGDLEALSRCLSEGRDLNAPVLVKPNRMPLHLAASNGHLPVLQRLLDAGADPCQLTTEGYDALALAVCHGHVHCIQPLLDAGCPGLGEPRGKITAQALAEMGVTVPMPDGQGDGQTVLAMAAGANQTESIKALLELGCDINGPCPALQARPVHVAAVHGAADALALLADRGANLSLKNSMGYTLLHCCCLRASIEAGQANPPCTPTNCGHAKCLRALFSRGFCLGLVDAPDRRGSTPLEVACQFAHVAPARVMLANGAAVDGPDPALAGPLTGACQSGCLELVELLLDSGARYPATPVKDGSPSPLQGALFEPVQSDHLPKQTAGHLECARLLLGRGVCSANEVMHHDPPVVLHIIDALLRFPGNCNADGIRLLLQHGAPATRGPQELSLLYMPAKHGFPAAVEALLEHGAELAPARRIDNALMYAADQPECCTLLLHASRSLPQAERRKLYSAPVPQGLPHGGKPTWQAIQDACGDRKCAKLLQQCLREAGLDISVRLPPRPERQDQGAQHFPGLAHMLQNQGGAPGSSSGSGSSSGAIGAGGGGSGSPAMGPAAALQQGIPVLLGSAEVDAESHMYMVETGAGPQVYRDLYERRFHESKCPQKKYGSTFDHHWASLPPAALKAEVQRLLQPLLSGGSGDTQDQTDVFMSLSNLLCSCQLRALLLDERLPDLLTALLTPDAARRRPVSWHQPVLGALHTLWVTEPRASASMGKPVVRYLWALLAVHAEGASAGGGARDEKQWALLHAVQLLSQTVGPVPVDAPLSLCEGGEDCARLLFLHACVATMAGQPDQTYVMTVIKALRTLQVVGIHSIGEPPSHDILHRSQQARTVFTQPCLLGAAVQCLQVLMSHVESQGTLAASFTQDLWPLLATCASEARSYGFVRVVLDGINNPHSIPAAHQCCCLLYNLSQYGHTDTIECFLKAGLLPALEGRLDALLAASSSPAAMAAVATAQTECDAVLSNTLMQCAAMCMRTSDCFVAEASNLKLAGKLSKLIQAVATAFGRQPQASIWSALLRQASYLLVIMCQSSAVIAQRLVGDTRLHLIIAKVLPRVDLSVTVNLLSLWMYLLKHSSSELAGEMRRQGGVPSATAPATVQQQQEPLPRMLTFMRVLARELRIKHVVQPILDATLRVMQGQAVDWSAIQLEDRSPHRKFANPGSSGSSGVGGQGSQAAPRCACCGVAASTAGVSLRKCSACREVAYCTTECQTRDWKFWHKGACKKASGHGS